MAGNNKITVERENEIEGEDSGTAKQKCGKLVVVTGFSGSGKGTVLKELFKLADYKYSISATTRPQRTGETHGVDYYFLSKEDFDKKINRGELLEHVEYSGNYYGTLRAPVTNMLEEGHNVILEIDVVGALKIKDKFPESLMIFITPPKYGDLEKRLRNRGTESEEVIKKRLEISKGEINYINHYDYFIINEDDKQKEAAEAIHAILNSAEDINTAVYKSSKERTEKFIEKYFA